MIETERRKQISTAEETIRKLLEEMARYKDGAEQAEGARSALGSATERIAAASEVLTSAKSDISAMEARILKALTDAATEGANRNDTQLRETSRLFSTEFAQLRRQVVEFTTNQRDELQLIVRREAELDERLSGNRTLLRFAVALGLVAAISAIASVVLQFIRR
jgi:hypothetical protein